jgi:uncharacterized membrane protein HdeD (DUF308 family)
MGEKIDVRKIQQKVFRDSMRDGVTEMITGVLLLCASLMFVNSGFTVLYLLSVIYLNKGMQRIREKYIHPRMGYVELKREEPAKTVGGILLYFFAVGLLMYAALYLAEGGLPSSDALYRWTPTFIGLMFLGAMLYLRDKTGSTAVLAWAAYAIALGLVFSIYEFTSPKGGVTLYTMTMGVSFLLVGFIKFRRFLTINPVIHEMEEANQHEARETT